MNTTISKAKSLSRLLNSQGIVATYEPVGNAQCHINEIVDLSKDVHIQVCDKKPTYNVYTYKGITNGPPKYVYNTNSQLDILKYLTDTLNEKTKSEKAGSSYLLPQGIKQKGTQRTRRSH